MNEVLKKLLRVLFHNCSPEKVLAEYLKYNSGSNYYKRLFEKPHRDDYTYRMNLKYDNLSDNEVINIALAGKQLLEDTNYAHLGVFAPLFKFAHHSLEQSNGSPVIKFERLLSYREVSHDIGTDTLICAFLAKEDFHNRRRRIHFDYPTALQTNNIRLQNMLKDGLAENHFHLKGSTHSSSLSWIYLMNHVSGQSKKFRELSLDQIARNTEVAYKDMPKGKTFHELVFSAVAIRWLLFCCLQPKDGRAHPSSENDENFVNIREFLHASGVSIDYHATALQRKLDILKAFYGKNNLDTYDSLDYATPYGEITAQDPAFMVFAGERSFLYNMFYAILEKNEEVKSYIDLFYAYLLISAKLRGELIQNNDKTGFGNFEEYQDRKSAFFKCNKQFEKAQVSVAFASTLGTSQYRIDSLEARIIPAKSKAAIAQQIKNYDELAELAVIKKAELKIQSLTQKERILRKRVIFQDSFERHAFFTSEYRKIHEDSDIKRQHFYVLHFPKSPDNSPIDHTCVRYCRHYKKRKDVEKQAAFIARLRESRSPQAMRIYGIDACANEIGCRPEVFAQAFRFLKNHYVGDTNIYADKSSTHPLRITYHVGEDFLDIPDGMRAIDEAINFLGISHGDRLGHAIALGIDVDYWYRQKDYTVVLPRQDLLDNCAWMMSKLSECGCNAMLIFANIYDEFKKQLHYIYQKNMMYTAKDWRIDHRDYIDSWRLRGDNPYLYYEISNHELFAKTISSHNPTQGSYYSNPTLGPYAANMPENELLKEIRRDNQLAGYLFNSYHFNYKVRQCGSEIVEYQITPGYIAAVKYVQTYMRCSIEEMNIGIECNPSSNVMIGGLKRYDRHPILTFNSFGLGEEQKNPQMFVSINTDDQGVFDTSLENEYALLACALHSDTDENGNHKYSTMQIYNYLDSIRKMGIEQSFNYQSRIFGSKQ